MKWILVTLAILSGTPGASRASTPPHSPSYCGPSVCIEISSSFGISKINSSFSPSDSETRSEVEAVGRIGKLTIVAESLSSAQMCKPSSSLNLRKADKSNLVAAGVIAGPDKGSCLQVSIAFIADSTQGRASGVIPMLAIWAVDSLPTTFWRNAYALRLGPQVEIFRENPGQSRLSSDQGQHSQFRVPTITPSG